MKWFIAVLLLVCLVLPALGKTHIIQVLGTQSLFGKSESRTQFMALMRRYPERENAALKTLGVDRAAFERGMRTAPSVVTAGPFHLDAMAYYSGGLKIIRDVDVPAHTYMWVVRLRHKTVYVPQSCGNVSTVAARAIAAYETSYALMPRARASQAARTPAQVVGARAPQARLATSAPLATPVAAQVTHHGGFPWWVFLVPVALIHGSSGNSGKTPPILGSSPSPSPSASCPRPTPKPTPTPCPTKTH